MKRVFVVAVMAAIVAIHATADARMREAAPFDACGAGDSQSLRVVKQAQSRNDESGQVTFTVTGTPAEAVLVAEAPAVKFERVSTEDGIAVRLEAPGDVVEVRANARGRIEFSRRGKARKFDGHAMKPADVEAIQVLAAGSPALQAFDAMAAILEDSNREESLSLLVTHALVSAVRGQPAANRTLARKLKAKLEPRFRQVAQRTRDDGGPGGCWDTYEREVYRIALQMEKCNSDYWWNPVMIAACSIEWTIRAELAFFWLISCSGGMPVR